MTRNCQYEVCILQNSTYIMGVHVICSTNSECVEFTEAGVIRSTNVCDEAEMGL